MFLLSAWYVLPLAFILDLVIGDPHGWPHPIRLMGRAISTFEKRFRKMPFTLRVSGGLFAISLISGTFIFAFFLISMFSAIHPLLGRGCEILLIYYCISARSLEKAAMEVGDTLHFSGLSASRDKLRFIVGREVDTLQESGVARATVETVAENLVDGVISPLFYAALLGAPFAFAFKMVNTLDSMVGYKNETYIDFGRVSAKIDDIMNYLPARMSVFVIAMAASIMSKGSGLATFKHGFKDGRKHASPNAGFPEAAFSGALQVKLGGPNVYHGKKVDKPYIGEDFGEVHSKHIKMACDLMLLSSFIWFFILWGVNIAFRQLI